MNVVGSGIDPMSGESVPGGMNSQWVVTYYSAKLKRNFAGVYGSDRGYVSCQDVKPADPLPPTQPDPVSSSAVVMSAAVKRLVSDAAARKIMPKVSASNLIYGQVTINIKPPVEKTWRVELSPWVLLVDDAGGKVIDCQFSGEPCK